jgi:hypothetical protein
MRRRRKKKEEGGGGVDRVKISKWSEYRRAKTGEQAE